MVPGDEEVAYDAASPSTPRAQAQKIPHPAWSQSVPMQLDSAGPSSSSNGQAEEKKDTYDESSDSSHQLNETDSKKEVWKKRKQM